MTCGCGCGSARSCGCYSTPSCNTSAFVGSQSCTSPNGACTVSPGVTITDAWDVPVEDSTIDVTAFGNLNIPVGVDVFSPAYGRYRITAINASGNGFTILTLLKYNGDDPVAGTNVPGYSNWILVETGV